MQIDGNHYTADEGKVFSNLENHVLGTELWLGVNTTFEDNFNEIDIADVVEPQESEV